jgi:hypothetical protein
MGSRAPDEDDEDGNHRLEGRWRDAHPKDVRVGLAEGKDGGYER